MPLSEQLQQNGFNMYPTKPDEVTTVKKRTMLQGQYKKGNELVKESKDKIMSTLPLANGRRAYIDNQPASDKSLLPSDAHPFDHFMVIV